MEAITSTHHVTAAQPLNLPEAVDLDKLPPERQQSILAAIEQLGQGFKPEDVGKDAGTTVDLSTKTKSEEPKANSVPEAGGLPPQKNCQHCGWDLTRPEPANPSDEDKLNFLQATIGQRPFSKTYSLLAGKLSVTLRTLSADESDLCFTQVAYDVEAGMILDPGQYFRTLSDYKLCLAIAKLETDSLKINLPDSVDKWQTDEPPPKNTKIKYIVNHIYDKVLVQETLRRAVAMIYIRFEQLGNELVARVDDVPFWSAIVGRP